MTGDDLPVLTTSGLTKSYGSFRVVKDIDLEIGTGEIVGLVGKNGAGKSTLIKLVTGAVSADAGIVRLAGVPLDLHSPAASRRRGIAVVHQELNLVPGLTLAENLGLGSGYPRRARILLHRGELNRRARQLLAEVDLPDIDPRTLVETLTPVQQRLVMIASALWHETKLLILDEPTASLSDTETRDLHRTVRRLRAAGTSVLFVSHRLDEVLDLTDRVVVMRDGALVAEAATVTLTKSDLVGLISGQAPTTGTTDRPPGATDPTIALAVNDLTGSFSTEPISLSVRAGEVLGIAGLVGAGRTELLRAIYGADRISSGTVEVSGAPVPRRSPRASLKSGLVLLTEDRRHQGLVTSFTVSANISLAALRRHRWLRHAPLPSRRSERSLAANSIRRLSIKTDGGRAPVMSLSGGNQQKVLLGRWLATEAKVILLDEPTVGIDVEAKTEIYQLIRRLSGTGLAVLVVSSEFAELEQLCHRVLVMAHGRVVSELTGVQVTETAMLQACFGSNAATTR